MKKKPSPLNPLLGTLKGFEGCGIIWSEKERSCFEEVKK
jgi:hypothetical protein